MVSTEAERWHLAHRLRDESKGVTLDGIARSVLDRQPKVRMNEGVDPRCVNVEARDVKHGRRW